MTPYYNGCLLGITGAAAMLVFWDFDELESWCAGYTDGLADRVLRPSARRFEAQLTTAAIRGPA